MEELSNSFYKSIEDIKTIFDNIKEKKEKLKEQIQKVFTQIRNEINNKEDELLIEVDKTFDDLFFKEDFIKKSEKIPNKLQILLEKGKIALQDNIDNLVLLLGYGINIEKYIEYVNNIQEKIKFGSNIHNLEVIFHCQEKKLIEEIKTLFKIVKNKNSDFSESLIYNDIEKQNQIMNWILEKTNKSKIQFELIFKMSVNGNKLDNFYDYCDNISPTLILIKSKDKLFGGFTPLKWVKEKGTIKDKSNQTFLFSLNLMKKYDMIKKEQYAINIDNFCICFGNGDLGFYEDLKRGRTYANSNCHFFSNNNLELIGEKGKNKEFAIDEFEVFHIT